MNKINLWASPRNISTAIMYSFAQRKDMTVVDEPFYASYLSETGITHPGNKEILKSQVNDFNVVLQEVINQKYSTPNVFFKQMSHHLMNYSKEFLLDCKNIILIRDPKEMIISFSKVIDKPNINDLGLKQSFEIFEFLQKNNSTPAVLDSNELLKNPKKVLSKLCELVSVPFDEKMLQWKPGKRKEDGLWAPYWYNNVHKSTGFKAYKQKNKPLRKDQIKLYEECLPLFEKLKQNSILS